MVKLLGVLSIININNYPDDSIFEVFDILSLSSHKFKKCDIKEQIDKVMLSLTDSFSKEVLMFHSQVVVLQENPLVKFRIIDVVQLNGNIIGYHIVKITEAKEYFEFRSVEYVTQNLIHEFKYYNDRIQVSKSILVKGINISGNESLNYKQRIVRDIISDLKKYKKSYVVSKKSSDVTLALDFLRFIRSKNCFSSIAVICSSSKFNLYQKMLLKESSIQDYFIRKVFCNQLKQPTASFKNESTYTLKSLFQQDFTPYCDVVVFEDNDNIPAEWINQFDVVIHDGVKDCPLCNPTGSIYFNCYRYYDTTSLVNDYDISPFKSITIVVPLSTSQLISLKYLLEKEQTKTEKERTDAINKSVLYLGNDSLVPNTYSSSLKMFIEFIFKVFERNKILFLTSKSFINDVGAHKIVSGEWSQEKNNQIVTEFNQMESGILSVDFNVDYPLNITKIDLVLHYDIRFNIFDRFLKDRWGIEGEILIIGLIPDKSIILYSFENGTTNYPLYFKTIQLNGSCNIINHQSKRMNTNEVIENIGIELVLMKSSYEIKGLFGSEGKFKDGDIIIVGDIQKKIDERYKINPIEYQRLIENTRNPQIPTLISDLPPVGNGRTNVVNRTPMNEAHKESIKNLILSKEVIQKIPNNSERRYSDLPQIPDVSVQTNSSKREDKRKKTIVTKTTEKDLIIPLPLRKPFNLPEKQIITHTNTAVPSDSNSDKKVLETKPKKSVESIDKIKISGMAFLSNPNPNPQIQTAFKPVAPQRTDLTYTNYPLTLQPNEGVVQKLIVPQKVPPLPSSKGIPAFPTLIQRDQTNEMEHSLIIAVTKFLNEEIKANPQIKLTCAVEDFSKHIMRAIKFFGLDVAILRNKYPILTSLSPNSLHSIVYKTMDYCISYYPQLKNHLLFVRQIREIVARNETKSIRCVRDSLWTDYLIDLYLKLIVFWGHDNMLEILKDNSLKLSLCNAGFDTQEKMIIELRRKIDEICLACTA